MKIQITTSNQENIIGYRQISIKNGKIDFEEISDNECTYILANNIIDAFSAKDAKQCIIELVKKLRLGGTLVVGGTDLRIFSLNVINGMLSPDESSDIIGSVSSMNDTETIVDIIKQLNLTIVSTQIGGVHYEISAQRK
jgi:tRNA A37 N6-isopentenylltransferase MiaA